MKRSYIEENYERVMFMDGYDDCIAGMLEKFGTDPIVIYDKKKVLNKMMMDGMTREEAEEFYEYNMIGAYVGELTPVFLETEEY